MSALRKILVVDDDPVVGRSFNRVLSHKGYAVITAENAEEAITKMNNAEYDVVFTDIKMPGMDGMELAERVKASHPWTPVVIITGYGTAKHEERAKAAGVAAFLHKPLSPEMIEETAATALLAPAPAVAIPLEAPPIEAARIEVVEKGESNFKKVALLLAGPFIGLAYVLLFPFVGLGYLAVAAARGLATLPMVKTPLTFVKDVALFIAAPFVGLLYVILFPFVGATMLAWTAVKALKAKRSVE